MVATTRSKRKKGGEGDHNTTPPTSKQKKKNTPQSSCPDEKADSEAGSEPNSPTITIGPGDKIVFMPYHLNKQVEATITSIAESSQHDEQLDIWTTQGLFDRTISDTLVLVHSNYTPNIPQGGLSLSLSQDNISLKVGNHQVGKDASDKRQRSRIQTLAGVAMGRLPPLPKDASLGRMTRSEKRAEEEFDRREKRGSDAWEKRKRDIEEVLAPSFPQRTSSDEEEDSTALPTGPDGRPDVTMISRASGGSGGSDPIRWVAYVYCMQRYMLRPKFLKFHAQSYHYPLLCDI